MDRKHSGGEKRFYWIGRTAKGRVLTTWFTRRGDIQPDINKRTQPLYGVVAGSKTFNGLKYFL